MATRRGFAAFCAFAIAAPALAQAPAPAEQEIVVVGEVPIADLPTHERPGANESTESRTLGTDSAFFVRCSGLPPRAKDLRNILDRGPRDTIAEKALHKYVIRHTGCFRDIAPFLPPAPSPYYGECNPQAHGTCRNTFDRGALYEAALAKYAADYRLGRHQTFDKAARARFIAREKARNHLRFSSDQAFFDAVSCFVQVSPEYAQALLAAKPRSAAETRARQYLIGYGSPCVGGAKTVSVGAAQFRAYTAEALYEWIVAAKGVATLVG